MRVALLPVALVLLSVLALASAPGCIAVSSTERCPVHRAMKGGEPLSCDLNIRLGDKAMVEGQPEEALRHYASAISFNPGLPENPDYQKRVGRARAEIACREAGGMAEEGDWDRAVLKYIEAVGADPEYGPAKEGQALARKQAAAMHYARGMELARNSDFARAAGEFQQALNYDPDNQAAREALKALGPDHPAPPHAAPPHAAPPHGQ